MILFGSLAAVLIGLSLGLVGGGGAILTVPVLVYLFGQAPTQATGSSLIIVGLTALVGAILAARADNVDRKAVLTFAPSSLVGVAFGRSVILQNIPSSLDFGSGPFSRDKLLMTAFALLMLAAATAMLRPVAEDSPRRIPPMAMFAIGFVTGMVAGILGAGGGFLIVPTLVVSLRLPMKIAVGTSLGIIAIQSSVGVLTDVVSGRQFDLALITRVAAFALLGLATGVRVGRNVPSAKLKPAFAVLVIAMAITTLAKEFL
jgi:uncharacterized membrane protein YfcA